LAILALSVITGPEVSTEAGQPIKDEFSVDEDSPAQAFLRKS